MSLLIGITARLQKFLRTLCPNHYKLYIPFVQLLLVSMVTSCDANARHVTGRHNGLVTRSFGVFVVIRQSKLLKTNNQVSLDWRYQYGHVTLL